MIVDRNGGRLLLQALAALDVRGRDLQPTAVPGAAAQMALTPSWCSRWATVTH